MRGQRAGAVRVVKPTIVMRKLLEDFAPTVLVISLVLGAAAAIAAMWIGRAIAQPIERLSEFSERVSAASAPPRRLGAFGREVTRLARSIDSMRRQLEGRPFVETFAADLSHELKNPVAAIRASAEVLEERRARRAGSRRGASSRASARPPRASSGCSAISSASRASRRAASKVSTAVDLARVARSAADTLGDRRNAW